MGATPIVIDHFCGAGGESTGIMQAANELDMNIELHAHNHWARAIETHSHNHPDAIHRQASIEDLNPMECIKGQRVALMWASPECTHHSVARGGRPCTDQSRATAMHVIKWAQDLYIDRIIVENVPEFLNWGPLGVNGRPMKSKKGETFRAWVGMLKSLGYRVDWRIMQAADYGAPTTRKRLFVQAARGKKEILWPERTHAKNPLTREPWIPIRDGIDFDFPSRSVFNRDRPLADATMKRIEIGIEKYWGKAAEPFLVMLRGTSPQQIEGSARSLSDPIPTITAGGIHAGLVQPFLTKFHGGNLDRNQDLNSPIQTVDCANRFGLVEPFIIASGHRSSIRLQDIDTPLSTVVTKAEHCLVEPLIMEYYGNGSCAPVSKPLRTVTTKDRFALIEGTYQLDIRFRMLQPHELAFGQNFPKDYWFSGTKADQVKQIGNAVPPAFGKAFAMQYLTDYR